MRLLCQGGNFGKQLSPCHTGMFQHDTSRMLRISKSVCRSTTCDILTAEKVKARAYLDFHSCFDDFECAKLELPLDYFNGTFANATVSVAIAKLPAKVPIDDSRYGGPILINPGGPGGPGALFALSAAKSLQWVVDTSSDPASAGDDARFFDIIGFDPRGIGETEPAATCISDPGAAWSWRLRENEEGILGSSDAALGRLWSMTHAFGSSCRLAMDGANGPDIKQYMTTAFVARDMLEIVERHAEYNARQAAQVTHDNRRCAAHAHRQIPLLNYTAGEAKLQYWGFSYGTFLGSTFASMFPNRVGRAVLDGVVNEWDYVHSLGNGSLVDNEKAMESFYSYCLRSGPACPLANGTTTAAEIKKRASKIVNSLYHNPFILTSADGPEVVTYSDIKSTIFSSIYQPQISFEALGHLLPQIEAGSGDLIDRFSEPFRLTHTLSCGVNGTVNPRTYIGDVPTFAILCADGVSQEKLDLNEFAEYWHLLQNMSSVAGDVWAMLRMKCAAWNISASYKFEGNFGGNTSHPLLFVSNTADPVTPLRSGRIMQSKFPNSALLINDQAGHCSFSAANMCAYGNIKEYFRSGALPANNTLCIPPPTAYSLNSTDPRSPFYDPTLVAPSQPCKGSEIGVEQQGVQNAAKNLQHVMAQSPFGFSSLIASRKAAKFQQLSAFRYLT